jgi:hypothetical protein
LYEAIHSRPRSRLAGAIADIDSAGIQQRCFAGFRDDPAARR